MQLPLQASHIRLRALQRTAQLRDAVLVFLRLTKLIGTTLRLAVVPVTQQRGMLLLCFLQFSLQHSLRLCVALALFGAVNLR